VAAIADALVSLAWVMIGLDNLWQARRAERDDPARGGVIAGGMRPSALLRAVVLLGTLAGFVALERSTGRLPFRPAAALAGLMLAAAGLALHLKARRVLGPLWSTMVTVRARHEVVASGPYALVRHPLYLAVLLLGAGTVLVHPSLATGCLLAGLTLGTALKIRIEERMLRQLVPGYEAYARRTPALVPWPLGRIGSRSEPDRPT
jgi:protein-S-isoprenylcysteine O-methyltransferase Ste14